MSDRPGTVSMRSLLIALALSPGCRALPPPTPLLETLRFGVIADVQYAAKPSKGARRYRASRGRLEEAVARLNEEPELAFVVQLGDVIDGRDGVAGSREDLETVLEILGRLEVPLVHVIGNHCLEVPRAELLPRLGLESSWRSFARGGWRFVILDTMAFSVSGVPADDARAIAAEQWLAEHPLAHRWNGGLGAVQRTWLEAQLVAAKARGERVILFAHHPLVAAAASSAHLAWDHAEVLTVLGASHDVVLWMNGHDHSGGYAEHAGVHNVTLEAMVEAPEGSNAWAVVELGPEGFVVEGRGAVTSRRLDWMPAPVARGGSTRAR